MDNKVKPIAFYLPQFHAIPENDEWWGKGFTEWTNVKKSKPLFKGHNQPEIPLNENYYDLSNVNVMIQQAELAKKFGVFGFCYYHYYFDGKLLLEKPLENMLNEKKVDIHFCLCWANETWARTWDGAETKVLIKQNYNEGVEGWKKHFLYLLRFFNDDRYILIDNKPLFVIYKPQLFKDFHSMAVLWNQLAIQEGFDGICFAFQYPASYSYGINSSDFSFGIEFEPVYSISQMNIPSRKGESYISFLFKHPINFMKCCYKKIFRKPTMISYDKIWKHILSREPLPKMLPGAFTSWDNSPRRGANATSIVGATPKKFEEYYGEQVRRAKELYHSDYIFINAWNEWAEGAHLEPDEKNKYGYLEAIKKYSLK